MKLLKSFIAILIILVSINTAIAKTLTVESDKQVYDDTQKLITLEDNVVVKIDDITVRSPKAFLTINAFGKPDTATFTDGVHAIQITPNSTSETKASILKLSLISKEVEATGDVESKMEKLGKPAITIKSDYQSFNTNNNLMVAKDNVVMIYDEIKTNSDHAKIWLNEKGGLKYLKLTGNAVVTQDQISIAGDEVNLDALTEFMTATGSVYTKVKTDETNAIEIWSKQQQYDNKANTAIANGSTVIHYSTYKAKGPKAVLLANPKTKKPDKVIFPARSKIYDEGKSIIADKIVITFNPKNFTAEGHVKTQIDNLNGLDADK